VTTPENIDCSGDAVVSVVAFSAPITFWTVEPGLRDQLVIWYTLPTQHVEEPLFVQLTPGQYDGFQFADMVKHQMNAAKELSGYELPDFECLYVASENRLGFSWGGPTDVQRTWRFLSPEQALAKTLPNWPWDVLVIKRLANRTLNLDPNPVTTKNGDSFITGYFDAFGGVSELYLHSPTLSQTRNLGPRLGTYGVDRSCIARVGITCDHGAVLHGQRLATVTTLVRSRILPCVKSVFPSRTQTATLSTCTAGISACT